MDLLTHSLWAGAAVTLLRRRRPIAPRAVVLTATLAVLPDLFQWVPLIAWWIFGDASLAALRAYGVPVPGHEPGLPPLVGRLAHHLHCIAHSAIVAGVVTIMLWMITRTLWIPLLGWWSHIVIDVFTHSADYYPVQVFYPITERGFDGLAWNTPWFLAINYVALATVWWLLLRHKRHSQLHRTRFP